MCMNNDEFYQMNISKSTDCDAQDARKSADVVDVHHY